MTRLLVTVGLLASLTGIAAGHEVIFHRTQVVDAKNHQAHADLVFSSPTRTMSLRAADHVLAEIAYDHIDKISYEFSKHHRIKEGAIVMVASLGAGGVVMLTKSKSHWLYVDYKENGLPKTLVLRMDKKEYKNIMITARAQTGKEVHFSNEANL
jgi:hypothetical protein